MLAVRRKRGKVVCAALHRATAAIFSLRAPTEAGVPKPPKHSFRTALKALLKNGGHAANPAHLQKWLTAADDPPWEQIASEARAHHPDGPDPCSVIIACAIASRHMADIVRAPHLQKREEQQREQQDSAKLLALAEKMDEVARNHTVVQQCVLYRMGKRGLSADESSVAEMETQESLAWLKREAQRLREFAKMKLMDQDWFFASWGIHVSRTGARKNGIRSRRSNVFMQMMVKVLSSLCGSPHYDSVAEMTDIFFADEEADVDGEAVRAACKSTTRKGRTRKAGTWNR
jgi:hypothetical protein